MLSELVQALVDSGNEAADDLLLEALRQGNEAEGTLALSALLRRRTLRGLSGIVGQYVNLPSPLQLTVLNHIKLFHQALRECARGRDPAACLGAMKLIALGRQGKLAFALSDGLHAPDEVISRAAAEAMVALARWVASETRRLQRSAIQLSREDVTVRGGEVVETEAQISYRQLIEQRPDIEQAVARALDVHRGRHGPELLRAALLLADWPRSKTLAILLTPKHGGQTAMVRRLQQPPDSEHVEAFLLGATIGNLRTTFGIVFSHISEPPVLDGLLRKTHWLKDHQLQLCMRQVTRGAWWDPAELERDLARRDDEDAARIGDWIAASGVHDVLQDERLERLRLQLGNSLGGRLRLLRLAMARPRGASLSLLRSFLSDPDERLARLAARDIVRRRPADFENVLIQLMAAAPDSVRRIVSRSVGQAGFEHFWERFERLDRTTRRAAGRAMLKVLPDGLARLERKLRAGPLEQRIRAMTVAQELGVAERLAPQITQLCHDPHPRLRSKAVAVLAGMRSLPPDAVLKTVLHDSDPRVRANAIEVLEARHRADFIPLLIQRSREGSNRERANAIKALHRMRVGPTSSQLVAMMQDPRPEHRISALWALRQIGLWRMLGEVGRLAKEDENQRVRRYAMAVLRGVADMLGRDQERRAAG